MRDRTVAAISPVTNLVALREFDGVTKEQVKNLNVAHLADKLADRAIWLSIGDDDQRVSTKDCTQAAQRLTAAARRQQSRAKTVPVKLVVGPTDGHSPIDDAYGRAVRFVLTRCRSGQ